MTPAPNDGINLSPLAILLDPQVVTSNKTVTVDMASQGNRLGVRAGIFSFVCGASGDTLSGSLKATLTMKEGDLANGSDAVACPAEAVLSTAGVGMDAQGNAYSESTGVVAVVDASSKDQSVYQIQYKGKKRYVTLAITLTGTHTNGTPWTILSSFIGHRRIGSAEGL